MSQQSHDSLFSDEDEQLDLCLTLSMLDAEREEDAAVQKAVLESKREDVQRRRAERLAKIVTPQRRAASADSVTPFKRSEKRDRDGAVDDDSSQCAKKSGAKASAVGAMQCQQSKRQGMGNAADPISLCSDDEEHADEPSERSAPLASNAKEDVGNVSTVQGKGRAIVCDDDSSSERSNERGLASAGELEQAAQEKASSEQQTGFRTTPGRGPATICGGTWLWSRSVQLERLRFGYGLAMVTVCAQLS